METVKISVDVIIDLSQSARAFLTNLFGGSAEKVATPILAPAQIEVPKVSASEPIAVEPETPNAEQPGTTSPEHSIDELRKELAAKVNSNREAIKAKLTAFGAKSLTTLAKDKYDEMFNFLISLTNG